MNDIFSDYCDLPTGVWKLEFLPGHEIAGWDEGVPVPALRWYGIGVYRNSLTYEQPTETSPQGPVTQVSVGCLVVNDSAAVATQLDQMEQMRFALRVTHYDARKRIVGAPEQLCELIKTEYTPTEIVGAQGYQLNFGGQFRGGRWWWFNLTPWPPLLLGEGVFFWKFYFKPGQKVGLLLSYGGG